LYSLKAPGNDVFYSAPELPLGLGSANTAFEWSEGQQWSKINRELGLPLSRVQSFRMVRILPFSVQERLWEQLNKPSESEL
jgi:hypothetical protein